MRYLGLDIGSRRIGTALSDEDGIIASPLGTIERTSIKSDVISILKLCTEYNVLAIVTGYPLGTDGKSTGMTKLVDRFISELETRFQGDIYKMDERFTTTMASKSLINAGVRRENRRKVVDKVAAAIILQSYLDMAK